MFQFDADGLPYRHGHPVLSAEMQEMLRHELVGYGWRWMQSNEILPTGVVQSKGFYDGLLGGSPSSYYVKSDSELVRYFSSDAYNQNAFWAQHYELDVKTGILSDGPVRHDPGYEPYLLRIWSIYEQQGKWYMSCIEPKGVRNGQCVWATSHFVRMTQSELEETQRLYDYDYSQHNK